MSISRERLRLPTSLRTPRLVLRRYAEGDGMALFDLVERNRARLLPWFPRSVTFVRDADCAEMLVQERMADWLMQESYTFGLCLEGRLVGQVALKSLEWQIPRAELGYFLDAACEGQGLMTEALGAALRFAFDELKLKKLEARVGVENARSRALLERLGFEPEGLIRNDFNRAGKLVDLYRYGKVP